MLKKMNDKDFQVPYIAKSKEITVKFEGLKPHIPKKLSIWKPVDIRYKDLSS
jgi:hypothetical protein